MFNDTAYYQRISRGEAAGSYQAFPDACRLKNGDVLCVFYAGYGHVSLPNREYPRGGRVCFVRSQDEGRTWSQPQVLYDGADDDRDPHIARLHDGTLVCSFFTYRKTSGGVEFDTKVVFSHDDGRTWSKRPVIGFPGHAPHLTRLSTGEILLTHRLPNTALHISRNEGRSWQGPYVLDEVIGAYPSTVELKDGSVLAIYYEEGEGSAVRAMRFRVHKEGIEKLRW
ncbi:MAG: sialidase family protein [Armatimonadota bacterium]